MGLYDERVNALRALAHGSDASTNFLSFDVLAASSVMDRQKMPGYPAPLRVSRSLRGPSKNTAKGSNAFGTP